MDDRDEKSLNKALKQETQKYHQLLVESLVVGVQVFVMSDKYQVPSAQLVALERVYWNMLYIFDEAECIDKCEESCLADGVAETFDFIYSHTLPDASSKCAIRLSLASMVKIHFNKFDGTGTIMEALEDVIQKHPDLASDLGRKISTHTNKRKGDSDNDMRKKQRT